MNKYSVFAFLLFIACSNVDNKSLTDKKVCLLIKNDSIECKEYSGAVLTAHYSLDSDSVLHGRYEAFYKNGEKKEIGYYYRGRKGNLYSYYDSLGKVKKKELYEESISDGSYELNLTQYITFDADSQIIYDKSYFFKIEIPETFLVGEPVKASIKCMTLKYDSMGGHFNILRAEDRYKEFEAPFFSTNDSTLNLSFDGREEAGNYLLRGVVSDYYEVLRDGDTFATGKKTSISVPFKVVSK